MLFNKSLVIAGIASLAVAVPQRSGCGKAIDAIITRCLQTEEPIFNACPPNDWKCMCETQQLVVTCYNNCPSDPRAEPAKQEQEQYCTAAKQYATTSSAPAVASSTNVFATVSQSSMPAPSMGASPSTGASGSGAGSGSGSGSGMSMGMGTSTSGSGPTPTGSSSGSGSSSSSSPAAAAGVFVPATGLFAVLLSAFALL